MNPPARLSDQSTRRTLVTRASITRPMTSNRTVSPTLMRNRSRRLSSIDTSASADGDASQNVPSRHRFVTLEVRTVGDGVLARQRAAAAHVFVVVEGHFTPLHAGDACAQDRQQPRRWCARLLPALEQRGHLRHLILLHVEQEHVGQIRRDVDAELGNEVLLKRAHPDDEEAAETDGEQHDARLTAGSAQLQHRVTQREPVAPATAAESRQSARCRRGAGRAAVAGKANRDNNPPTAQRARLPDRERDQPGDDDDNHE